MFPSNPNHLVFFNFKKVRLFKITLKIKHKKIIKTTFSEL